MDRIGDIALFLRVLDLGSISAAARSLDLSVAVASQRLKRLERDLGVLLQLQLHAAPARDAGRRSAGRTGASAGRGLCANSAACARRRPTSPAPCA